MLLNNTLFNVDTLLGELQQKPKGAKSALEILQIKLKTHYFDKNTSNEDVLKELNNPGFTDFPRLHYVLQQIFSGKENFEIPEDLKDWEPTTSFEQLNNQYGYFNQDLSTLFQQLAVACKKMTSLIERQTHDDEMAYKLMALFYDPNLSIEKNFEQISKKFDKLITTKQDKTIKTPYHDAFVTTLHHFPKFEDVQGLDGWKSFIIKEGFKSLDIFASCATQIPAFENIKEANTFLLAQTYPRAHENPTLAKLCKALLIKNEGFEAGLVEVKTGWPKKVTDNLPIVDIQDNTGNYFWVKLPPQDMRALYLGNLIPGCCQHIGGHSEQCVKDGIERSDNGFYVLLKSKRAQGNSNRIVDNQVNDKDYDIVAQSYAWKTSNGNLCLDSIEWNSSRVTKEVIQDLMTKFSEKVFADHPDIKYINVGKGGQTPQGIYPNCPINETMKQGYLYGDAKQQYQIECNIPKEALDALKERLKDVPQKDQNSLLYLAPYIQDIENVPGQLMSILDKLPQMISKINFPIRLSTDDFRKVTFAEYQNMESSQQSSISTACKIFNSHNGHELHQWLPTISDDDLLVYVPISYLKKNCSLAFQVDFLQRLPKENQLKTLIELDYSNRSILNDSENNIESIQTILTMFPTDAERINALKSTLMQAITNPEILKKILNSLPRNQCLEAVTEKDKNGKSILMHAISNPESLKMILELLPETKRLEAIKEQDKDGISTLMSAVYKPISLKMILELISERLSLEDIKEKDKNGQSMLMRAVSYPESLQMIFELISERLSLEDIKEKDKNGQSILMRAVSYPESLQMIFELRPEGLRLSLEDIKEKDKNGQSILMRAVSYPESLQMIFELRPEGLSLEDVKEKDIDRKSILMRAASYPESLKIILEHLPETQRLEAVTEFGNSILMQAVSNPESLKIILELLPEMINLEAVTEKDEFGNSILMQAVSNPESLKIILESLPESKRLEAVTEMDGEGKSILVNAINKPSLLNIILELLPEMIILEAVTKKDKFGNSILVQAVSNPESLKIILESLPESKRLEAVTEKDGEGKSILISAVNKPSLLKIILESLPESLRLDTVQEKDKHGRTMLMDAAYNPESLKIVLDLYPTNEDRLNAIKKTNENTWSIKSHKGRFDLFSDLPRDIVNKKSILMIAASNPETLKIILDLYPTNEELLEVLKEKDAYGNSTLMYAASNPETLKIILDLYPTNEELLEVLKEKNNAGESTLMYMVSKMDKSSNYSENLKMILTLYPTEERLNAIRERNRYGNSILMNAAINFKNLKMIIDLLPEHQRFEAVKEKYGPSQNSILFSYAEFDKLLVKVILETLPADITMVIRACAKNLNKNDFEKLTFSMLDFMANMKELATPETINHFVHAVIINQDIEPALTALLSPPSSSSFFKSDSKVAIQECISKLDSHWLERISKVVHDDPTIDAPKKF